jgi:O-antigen/teichoic acid export membrane protein
LRAIVVGPFTGHNGDMWRHWAVLAVGTVLIVVGVAMIFRDGHLFGFHGAAVAFLGVPAMVAAILGLRQARQESSSEDEQP